MIEIRYEGNMRRCICTNEETKAQCCHVFTMLDAQQIAQHFDCNVSLLDDKVLDYIAWDCRIEKADPEHGMSEADRQQLLMYYAIAVKNERERCIQKLIDHYLDLAEKESELIDTFIEPRSYIERCWKILGGRHGSRHFDRFYNKVTGLITSLKGIRK